MCFGFIWRRAGNNQDIAEFGVPVEGDLEVDVSQAVDFVGMNLRLPADFMHEDDLVLAFGPSATGARSLSTRTPKAHGDIK